MMQQGPKTLAISHIPTGFPSQHLKCALRLYVQNEPIGLSGRINTYANVGRNPVSFMEGW